MFVALSIVFFALKCCLHIFGYVIVDAHIFLKSKFNCHSRLWPIIAISLMTCPLQWMKFKEWELKADTKSFYIKCGIDSFGKNEFVI